ncbi:MAG: bacterioferritin-associated ferredoxin [Myxococcota bacterium]|jgi:bacterioferritin-associated ferredoxin
MIVCLCEGVSDREVRASIQRGADSVREISQQSRAGTDCGRCRSQLRQMLQERALSRDRDGERVSVQTLPSPA